jgi:hypothetical protein
MLKMRKKMKRSPSGPFASSPPSRPSKLVRGRSEVGEGVMARPEDSGRGDTTTDNDSIIMSTSSVNEQKCTGESESDCSDVNTIHHDGNGSSASLDESNSDSDLDDSDAQGPQTAFEIIDEYAEMLISCSKTNLVSDEYPQVILARPGPGYLVLLAHENGERREANRIWARITKLAPRQKQVRLQLFENRKYDTGNTIEDEVSKRQSMAEVRPSWFVPYFHDLAEANGISDTSLKDRWGPFKRNAIAAVLKEFSSRMEGDCEEVHRHQYPDLAMDWRAYKNEKTSKPKCFGAAQLCCEQPLSTSERVALTLSHHKEPNIHSLAVEREISNKIKDAPQLLYAFAVNQNPKDVTLNAVATCLNELFDPEKKRLTNGILVAAKLFCKKNRCNTKLWWNAPELTAWVKSLQNPTTLQPLWRVLSSENQPSDEKFWRGIRRSDKAYVPKNERDKEEEGHLAGEVEGSIDDDEPITEAKADNARTAAVVYHAPTTTSSSRAEKAKQECLDRSSKAVQAASIRLTEARSRQENAHREVEEAERALTDAKTNKKLLKRSYGKISE